MKYLNKEELKELLIKSWMTHDGLWFRYTIQEFGIEKVNKVNKAASKSLGLIEIKRYKNIFNIEKIKNFEDFKSFIDNVFSIVKADFMKFSYSFPIKNQFYFEMHQCFAHNGVEQLGVIDRYRCGIVDRIEGWFEGLEIKYAVSPKVDTCLIYKGEKCFRNYTFFFT
jgi:hypothetical protein